MGFHFLQEGMEPWILILCFKKKNDENTNIWKGYISFSVKFALRIEVEILLVAERVEAKKDWNEKPGEPFGENALIIVLNILTILCLETKNQNSRLYQIMLKI